MQSGRNFFFFGEHKIHNKFLQSQICIIFEIKSQKCYSEYTRIKDIPRISRKNSWNSSSKQLKVHMHILDKKLL